MVRRYLGAILVLSALSACADREPLTPAPDAPAAALAAGDPQALEVKFRSALDVRLRGGEVVSAAGVPLDGVAALLDPASGVRTTPLFTPEALAVEALAEQAAARSGEAAPDLGSWYRVTLPAGTDTEAFLAQLRARPEVEHAYRAPVPAPPPGFFAFFVSPDFTGQQGYLGAAPAGTEAVWARTLAGGDGAGVMVVDLEYDWHLDHEDLTLPVSTQIGTGTRYTGYGSHHGTAVLGELAGRVNGFGVSGGVPGADIRVIPPMYGGYNPANAIAQAAAYMSAGDVLLIEQQYPGATGAYVPLEVLQSVFDATRAATLAGRIVVAAAGNGAQNLDAPEMGGLFDRNLRDSGALIVGAGSPLHARLSFSCYGSRVDVQGWGQTVTTTGYGGLFGSGLNDYYTSTFSGTSSASPIVASAAAAVNGRRKARGLPVLSSVEMRTLLRNTGSSQTGDLSQNIGTYPNLRAALTEANAPGAPAGVGSVLLSATSVRLSWAARLDSVTHYEAARRVMNADSTWGDWVSAGSVEGGARFHDDTGLTAGGTYRHRVRACNDAMCSGWVQTAPLRVAPPAAPSSPAATPLSGTSLRLAWRDGGTTETGFSVERRRRLDDGTWTGYAQVGTPAQNATAMVDSLLIAGVSYQYRVRACNAAGCSAPATGAAVLMPTAPVAPSGVAGNVVSPSSIRVTWADSSGNETGFVVMRRARPVGGSWGSWVERARPRANAVAFADTGVTAGGYQYRVRACNGPVCSASATGAEVVMPSPPAAPTGLAVTALSATSVHVTWTDGSGNETSFGVQRRLRNLDGTWTPWAAAGSVPANSAGIPNGGLLAGRTYEYRVASCIGVVCSSWTPAVRVTLPAS